MDGGCCSAMHRLHTAEQRPPSSQIGQPTSRLPAPASVLRPGLGSTGGALAASFSSANERGGGGRSFKVTQQTNASIQRQRIDAFQALVYTLTLYGGAPPRRLWCERDLGETSAWNASIVLLCMEARRPVACGVNAPGARLYVDFVWRRAAPSLVV